MKLLGMTPTLWVPNVQDAVDFYTKFLGFTCENWDREEGWAYVERDELTLMFAEPHWIADFDGPDFTGSLYFNVDDVDGLWDTLKNLVTVEYELENMPYGMREFAIRDYFGYILQFGRECTEDEIGEFDDGE